MNGQYSASSEGNICSKLMNIKAALKAGDFYELNESAKNLQSLVDAISASNSKVPVGELKMIRDIASEVMRLIQASMDGIRVAQVEILRIKKVSTGLTTYQADGTFGIKL